MQEGVMEKRYVVSAGLSAVERISVLAVCGLLVICWVCAFCSGFFGPTSVAAAYRWLAFYLSLTVLFLVIVRLILARDMLKTIWDVSETSIVRKSPTRIVSVDFNRFIRFRYCHVPLLFNAGLIRYRGGTLFLSFYIQGLAGLIADIRDGLSRSQNPGACDHTNLEEYTRAARTADLCNDRLKRFMPSLLSVMIVVLCVSIMTSLYLWHFPLMLAFMWAVVVLLLFLSSVVIAEALLSVNYRREAASKRHSHETQVYLLSGMFAFVVCLCCGILLSTAFAR
jgi:hypothetical protein